MLERSQARQARRIVVVTLTAALLVPAIGRAQEEEPVLEPSPPEAHWYDGPVRVANVTVDVLVIRPLGVITFVGGSILFVPAALMTLPNGRDSLEEAWERFVKEPGRYVWGRPLGEL